MRFIENKNVAFSLSGLCLQNFHNIHTMNPLSKKDFDTWNQIKKQTEKNIPKVYFHPREVWFCKLGENIGAEQNGKGRKFLRPIIILKKFNTDVFWGLPLTSQSKKGKFYLEISKIKEKRNWAILSQLRLIDKKRLQHKLGSITKEEFTKLKKAIKVS